MQVILVLTDVKNKEGQPRLTFSMFEKPQDKESLDESLLDSPAIQLGTMLSSFLKTIEQHGKVFIETVINEERKTRYSKNDFRYHIKKYDNVIEIDLKNWKPKGKKH